MQEKLSQARNSPEARKKRSESLKAWAEENPEEAKANAKKRSAASVAKCSKPVNMCDLETGEIIRTFKSQHEAAQWLVDNGLAMMCSRCIRWRGQQARLMVAFISSIFRSI